MAKSVDVKVSSASPANQGATVKGKPQPPGSYRFIMYRPLLLLANHLLSASSNGNVRTSSRSCVNVHAHAQRQVLTQPFAGGWGPASAVTYGMAENRLSASASTDPGTMRRAPSWAQAENSVKPPRG
jgi:hypothetical protein